MARNRNIDGLLRDWPYKPNRVAARLVKSRGGREVIQLRIELGLLQMETTGRPDGERPKGLATYYDYLVERALVDGKDFRLSARQRAEVDREFAQYYHRRICWMALGRFAKAVADAEHTLKLMDLIRDYSSDEEWLLTHEQYRPFVLFHRTQAAALARLEIDDDELKGAEAAIEEINRGLARIRDVFEEVGGEEQYADDEMVRQLTQLQGWLRERYDVERTLAEQLADAVATEQYELAARLRDKMNGRAGRH
jgi:hypothetical protein